MSNLGVLMAANIRVDGKNLKLNSIRGGSTVIGAPDTTVIPATTAKLWVHQPTLADPVLKLSATATGNDPKETTYMGRVATTDATPTTLFAYTIQAANSVVRVELVVIARRTAGSAGTAGDVASYHLEYTFKNIDSVTTEIGSVTNLSTKESQAGFDCALAASAGVLTLTITGATNNTVSWHLVKFEVTELAA